MDIADMHLNHRCVHTLYRIHHGYAVMRIGTSIQDDTIIVKTNLLNLVYQLTLNITLVIVNLNLRICISQTIQILIKTCLPVYFWFPFAKQVQIWAIDDLDSHNYSLFLRVQRYKKKQSRPSFYQVINPIETRMSIKATISNTGNVPQDIVKRYIQYLRLERSYSSNTLDAYCKDLQKLFNFYSDNGIDFRTTTLTDFDLFAGNLRDEGISSRSLARILSGVRSFYRFLMLEKEIEQDPTELLESPKIGNKLPQVLSVDEIDNIQGAIDLSKPEGIRDHCIIEVLYSCGLRISELTNLQISDLFLDEGFIRIHGKGDKERLVPISAKAIKELRIWLDVRKHIEIQNGHQDYVFVSRTRGKKLSRISLFVFIRKYAQKAGITKEISPHTFRHSFATHLLQGGANLRAVQEMLGHENLGTTEIYMHIDITHLREGILTCHPRGIRKTTQNT